LALRFGPHKRTRISRHYKLPPLPTPTTTTTKSHHFHQQAAISAAGATLNPPPPPWPPRASPCPPRTNIPCFSCHLPSAQQTPRTYHASPAPSAFPISSPPRLHTHTTGRSRPDFMRTPDTRNNRQTRLTASAPPRPPSAHDRPPPPPRPRNPATEPRTARERGASAAAAASTHRPAAARAALGSEGRCPRPL
jgi:hypothetical protein